MKRKQPQQDAGFHEEWDEDDSEDLLVEGRGYVTDGVSTVTTCNVQGCNQVTNHLKPVCQNHIMFMPAAKRIRAELDYRAKEERWAGSKKHRKKVDPRGTRATDLRLVIAQKGVVTISKLCMDVDLPRNVVEGYLDVMERAGLIHRRILRTMRKLKVSIAVTTEGMIGGDG